MTKEAKKDIEKLVTLVVAKGINKIGQKKFQKMLEAIMTRHGLTENELMDEYDVQFQTAINA